MVPVEGFELRYSCKEIMSYDLKFFVYILKCKDGSYYVGHTDDIDYRISEHQAGKGSPYTSKRLPVQVEYVAKFGSRDEALITE